MCQRKCAAVCDPIKGMIVAVLHFGALCGHSGVAHYRLYLCRKSKTHPPGRKWPLVDTELRPGSICDSGRICSTDLTGNGKGGNDPVLLLCGKRSAVIIKSKQAAHYSSTSLSTGSLRYSRRSFRYWINSGSVTPAIKSDHESARSSSSFRHVTTSHR